MFLLVFGDRMLRALSNFNCICYITFGFWRAVTAEKLACKPVERKLAGIN